MTSAKSAHGTFLKIGNGATTETFATIAEVRGLKGPTLTLETEEVTSHDSAGYAEYIGVIKDGGEVTFDINWLPANATHAAASAGLVYDLVNMTKRNFQLVMPAASSTTWSFTALVTSFEPDLPEKGPMAASVTLKITGAPTLA